jgi:hypothetical protein
MPRPKARASLSSPDHGVHLSCYFLELSLRLLRTKKRIRQQYPERFSARQKTEVVLRLLRGEALDLLSRELGIPAARLATWREAFLTAGQEAMKTHPLDTRDRELGRLREKLGESTMDIELLREKIGRLETNRPFAPRRSRR